MKKTASEIATRVLMRLVENYQFNKYSQPYYEDQMQQIQQPPPSSGVNPLLAAGVGAGALGLGGLGAAKYHTRASTPLAYQYAQLGKENRSRIQAARAQKTPPQDVSVRLVTPKGGITDATAVAKKQLPRQMRALKAYQGKLRRWGGRAALLGGLAGLGYGLYSQHE